MFQLQDINVLAPRYVPALQDTNGRVADFEPGSTPKLCSFCRDLHPGIFLVHHQQAGWLLVCENGVKKDEMDFYSNILGPISCIISTNWNFLRCSLCRDLHPGIFLVHQQQAGWCAKRKATQDFQCLISCIFETMTKL